MSTVSKVDLLASHWLSLRGSPVRVCAQGRAQARAAWRDAAAAYERTAQSALPDGDADAAAQPPATRVHIQHPG